ncbi:hypothetical protein I6N56_12485 [Acinetobacter baumannii]|uniref:hypothetical protein n=1 Tax=Acinetobacter baumannii TaxID=470 RepID=UPI001FB222A2|nr:hypothetical protein [Acinetobacter baumannii]MCJ1647116.1 hypothetical protein [Acinetobacter baumannii]
MVGATSTTLYSNEAFKRSELPPLGNGAVISALGIKISYLFPSVSVIGALLQS